MNILMKPHWQTVEQHVNQLLRTYDHDNLRGYCRVYLETPIDDEAIAICEEILNR